MSAATLRSMGRPLSCHCQVSPGFGFHHVVGDPGTVVVVGGTVVVVGGVVVVVGGVVVVGVVVVTLNQRLAVALPTLARIFTEPGACEGILMVTLNQPLLPVLSLARTFDSIDTLPVVLLGKDLPVTVTEVPTGPDDRLSATDGVAAVAGGAIPTATAIAARRAMRR